MQSNASSLGDLTARIKWSESLTSDMTNGVCSESPHEDEPHEDEHEVEHGCRIGLEHADEARKVGDALPDVYRELAPRTATCRMWAPAQDKNLATRLLKWPARFMVPSMMKTGAVGIAGSPRICRYAYVK